MEEKNNNKKKKRTQKCANDKQRHDAIMRRAQTHKKRGNAFFCECWCADDEKTSNKQKRQQRECLCCDEKWSVAYFTVSCFFFLLYPNPSRRFFLFSFFLLLLLSATQHWFGSLIGMWTEREGCKGVVIGGWGRPLPMFGFGTTISSKQANIVRIHQTTESTTTTTEIATVMWWKKGVYVVVCHKWPVKHENIANNNNTNDI